MPATAVQLPFVRDPAARTGSKLFRKQILPLGDVTHPEHGTLTFTADRLARLRDRFLAGAMDCVPFVLVDAANAHTDDPERARGEVRGVELAADGLYATIETSDRGTLLLSDTPNLPVSVRLKTLADGSEVLAHVAGTHDPVAKGMRTWEAIDASAGVTVQDFSDRGVFTLPSVTDTKKADEKDDTAADALSKEEVGKFRAFLNGLKGDKQTETTVSDADRAAAAVVAAAEAATADAAKQSAEKQEPVTASLSDEDKAKLDMSHSGVIDLTVRLGVSELTAKLDAYVTAGAPPALVNAARASLLTPETGKTELSDTQKATIIDFANRKVNPATSALFAALDAAKGTIDFEEKGATTTVDMSTDDAKAAQKMCDTAAEGYC